MRALSAGTQSLLATVTTFLVVGPLAGQQPGIERLIDFESVDASEWFVVNDGVMGGRSSSTLREGLPGIGIFEGVLSLENNGGFASVRTAIPEAALTGASRVVLRVRGDGQQYQLRLRPGRRFDGVAYAASFETRAGEWTTVEIPIGSFEPTFRGYRPSRVDPLDPSDIGQLGIMLTDKQEGPFRLEIDWIGIGRSTRRR